LTEDCLFVFARALKAFSLTTGTTLKRADLDSAFSEWWRSAKPMLAADTDFDEERLVFLHAYSKARAPLGANPLHEAIHRADSRPLPPQAERYRSSVRLRRLVAACYHLQSIAGENPFFLSVRDAADILGTPGQLNRASACLTGLVGDGILTLVTPGTPGGRRATRYRFGAAK
jgi:hypothetical protein